MTVGSVLTRRALPIDHGRFFGWLPTMTCFGWDGWVAVPGGEANAYMVEEASLERHLCELKDTALAEDLGVCFYENWPGLEAFKQAHGVSFKRVSMESTRDEQVRAGYRPTSHRPPDDQPATVEEVVPYSWLHAIDTNETHPTGSYNPRTGMISVAGREYPCSPPDQHGHITFHVPPEDFDKVRPLQGGTVSVDCELPTVSVDPNWQPRLTQFDVSHPPHEDATPWWVHVEEAMRDVDVTQATGEALRRMDEVIRQPRWEESDLPEWFARSQVRWDDPPKWVEEFLAQHQVEVARPGLRPWMSGEFDILERNGSHSRERNLRERYCDGTCAMLDAEPHLHDPGCPVAPVPGLHGGMRAAPEQAAEAGVKGWQGILDNVKDGLLGQMVSLHSPLIPEYRDRVLMAFYLPPAQPDDKSARLPVDDDPDLAAVADTASRHPNGWRTR